MPNSLIINPSKISKKFSLTVGDKNEAISSYICGKTGSGAMNLALRDILKNALNGGGVFVDLNCATTKDLLTQLPDIAKEQNKRFFHLDLTVAKKQFNFKYNPFHGKTKSECIFIAESMFLAKKGQEDRIAFAQNLLAQIIHIHFAFYEELNFRDLLFYIREGGIVDLYQRLGKSIQEGKLTGLRATYDLLGKYFVPNFNNSKFIEDLNGLSGILAILMSDFKSLLDFEGNSNGEILNFADAINQGDFIVFDYGFSDHREIEDHLAEIVKADLHVSLINSNTANKIHFSFYTNYRAVLSKETMLHILHKGKERNLSLVPVYQSYFHILENDTPFLYALSCTVKQQVFFSMVYSESEHRGLNPQQLKICESLDCGNFLIIKQEHNFLTLRT